jgi:lipopolysaccharide transport system ATP-binding protein
MSSEKDVSAVAESEPVIRAENLGKAYRVYKSPSARLKQALMQGRRRYYEEFWALRSVDMEVSKGEAIGVIGRNGSGKSTLLQLICGTLTPSEGSVNTHGRVGALLELGSGFNPEFTGIENIHLNASLLGLSTETINARLDDILAFADIGDFVTQPIKTFSSGMVLRLAFAVLANVNPDVLIIDEALAVGDAVFTQRCMRFIHTAREKMPLLFVSHDPASVSALCDRCVWLNKGRLESTGPTRVVLDLYTRFCYAQMQNVDTLSAGSGGTEASEINAAELPGSAVSTVSEFLQDDPSDRGIVEISEQAETASPVFVAEGFGDGAITIESIGLTRKGSTQQDLGPFHGGEELELRIRAQCIREPNAPSVCGFLVRDKLGLVLFGDNTLLLKATYPRSIPKPGQAVECVFTFRMPALKAGEYSISIGWASGSQEAHVQNHYVNDALVITSDTDTRRPVHGRFAADILGISLQCKDP